MPISEAPHSRERQRGACLELAAVGRMMDGSQRYGGRVRRLAQQCLIDMHGDLEAVGGGGVCRGVAQKMLGEVS